MTRFTRKPIKLLDGIYRFVGGLTGVDSVDLKSDITLVHDVSRQAERTGYGSHFGRVWWGEDITVNGTNYKILWRSAIGPQLGFENENYELWMIQGHAQCLQVDISDIDSVGIITGRDPNCGPAGTPYGYIQLETEYPSYATVAYWTAMQLSMDSQGAAKGSCSTAEKWPRPIRVQPGGFVGWQLKTSATATIEFSTEMWAGPPGSTPPGMG